MSKDLFLRLAVVAGLAMVAGGMLSGCEEPLVTPDPPTAELTLKSAGATDAVLVLKTSSISEYAWAVYSETPGTAPTADVLFMSGTVGNCVDGDNEFTVSGLEGNTDYTLYLAAKTVEDEYYQEILSATFTTTDYTEPLTVLSTDYTSFSVHVQVPESVVEAENALRYALTDLFTYNSNKAGGWMGPQPDSYFLQYNGGAEYCIQSSQTLTFDNSEESTAFHMPFAPGEPAVFIVGEFSYLDDGYNPGYFTPLFDELGYMDAWYANPEADEDSFWTGHHARTVVQLRQPEKLDATVAVETDIKAVTGSIKLNPDPEVVQYCVLIADNAAYQQILGFLDNNEDYLQWFTSSYAAFMNYAARSFTEPVEIKLEELFYEVPENTHYHLMIVAMGDAEGTTQSFQHLEFDTAEKSLPAPEITVTPVGGEIGTDPFEVVFNVKNTGDVPVTSASYNANYVREWESLLGYGMSYEDILTSAGNELPAEIVALINSEDGYDLRFTTIDGMTTRVAVIAYNEEKTHNVIEADGPAVAEQTSPEQPASDHVESPLFGALPGEWTMTAEVSSYDYTGGYESLGPQSTKVTIYDGLDCPDTLPDEVYDTYLGSDPDMTREDVDALYASFKLETEAYNARVRGQNRLLCVGFGHESYPYALVTATPYELFCDPSYSAYDVASLFYDFGPKWYLEVAEDGSVTVPTNSSTMYPLSAWTGGPYYLAGNDPDEGYVSVLLDADGRPQDLIFPVDVADDNATVVVNPATFSELEGAKFYPNALSISSWGGSLAGNRIDSALTLTKGWTEDSGSEAAPASVRSTASNDMPKLSPVWNTNLETVSRPMSRTVVPESAFVRYRQVEDFKVLTADELEKALNAMRQQNQSR